MTLLAIITGIAMTLGASEEASADVIFATGFEPPTYTTGSLSGQEGWNNNGGGTVETTTVFAGTQAVEYDATGATGQSTDAHVVPLSGQGRKCGRPSILRERE